MEEEKGGESAVLRVQIADVAGLTLFVYGCVCMCVCARVFSMASAAMNGNKAVWLLLISNLHIL